MLALLSTAAAGFLVFPPLAPAVRPSTARFSPLCMNGEDTRDPEEDTTEWERYQALRGQASFESAQDEYKTVRTARRRRRVVSSSWSDPLRTCCPFAVQDAEAGLGLRV